jgi:tight adherence protein B
MTGLALRAVAAVLVAVAVAASPAAASEPAFELAQAAATKFPDRAFVLTLPSEMSLSADAVHVRENGEVVKGASVAPASGEAGQSAVVLVIDASNSMRGDAIQGAVAAAKAFAAQRDPFQQVAIIAFNRRWWVLLPFTSSQDAIDHALAQPPPLAGGTLIYDAVGAAVDLLEQAEVPAGSVIVLSDGADTGSSASLKSAAKAAQDARVRIFSVGLHGVRFVPDALKSLAGRAGGDYSDAGSAGELAGIFDQLGQRLASEYLIRYRSSAEPGDKVRVAVTVDGIDGVATSVYVSPSSGSTPGGPFHRSLADIFLRSTGAMVAAGVVSALLLVLALVLLVRPRSRSVRARMAEFVSVIPPEDKSAQRRSDVLALAEKSFEQARWWARFKEELEIAGIRMPPIQIVLWTAVATLFAMWFLVAVGGSVFFAPLAIGIPFVVHGTIDRALQRERNRFADQLPDNLQVLSSALRAGHSLVGALSVVVEDCVEPSRSEFRRVVADEQLGVPLEEALGVVARRMASTDLGQVALVSALQRETGGNTAEVLDRVAENVRGRFELRRLVKTLTAQGRMSRWIVSFLPVGLLGLITLINPEYMAPLYTHSLGRVLLVIAAVMVVGGSLVIRRIVNIKV